jgi:hypothetical protein
VRFGFGRSFPSLRRCKFVCRFNFDHHYRTPNQSFVLGEGKHGGYTAKIVNKSEVEIEVFGERENEERKSLGVLKPKDKNEYNAAKNTKVIFKNLGNKTAAIGIKLSGDTSLSMGYKPNKQ